MKSSKLCSLELLVITLIASGTTALAQSYTIRDLGAVSGDSVSSGYALNTFGQAAGTSSSPGSAIATLFSGGQAIDLGTLEPLDVSVATGINGSAEVVGYEPFSSDQNNLFHAFLYSNGALHDIHSPSLFPSGTSATAINNSGVVVGQGWLNSSSFHAFVYAGGQMVDLGPPGSYQASAVAINNSGQVLGNAYFTSGGGGAFVYASGKFTYLTPPAGASVGAFAINSVGQAAGAIYGPAGTHAAVCTSGKWTDLGGITGAAAHATGINTAGQVVGTAIFPQTVYHPPKPGKHVGFIIGKTGPVDLNTLIPAGSGFVITDAIAINDSGQILCDAASASSAKRAVLLTPK
jgi:probable HAF family extracellular repeat protein